MALEALRKEQRVDEIDRKPGRERQSDQWVAHVRLLQPVATVGIGGQAGEDAETESEKSDVEHERISRLY